MVGESIQTGVATGWLLAQEPALPVIERLDPPRRAAVIMALLGLVLTGVLLVACVMIGARWVRRLARRGLDKRSEPTDQGGQAWREVLRKALPDAKTSETVSIDGPSDETRAGD